jgi:predicted transcriptional regulator
MTTTLTVRLPASLARELKTRAKAAKTSPSAVLRRAAADYVRQKRKSPAGLNAMQEHINSRAGTWDGDISGEELLRRTRP